MRNGLPPRTREFPARKQLLLDELLDKSSEGTITPSEKAKLEELVAEAEELMAENARRLVDSARSDGEHLVLP